MEGKGSFFNIVLLFILAFLALTLFALAGYIFIVKGPSSNSAAPSAQVMDTKIPADADTAEYEIYTDKQLLNLKISDPGNAMIPVIQVTVSLGYLKKPKNSSVKDPLVKITLYDKKIKQLVSTYFQELTRDEAFLSDSKEKASKELSKKINEMLNATEEKKANIVYEVVFPYWLVT